MDKTCCGFGHSFIISDSFNGRLCQTVDTLVFERGFDTFLSCGTGDFDKLFASAVCDVKRNGGNVRLILVLPYMMQVINNDKFYYSRTFDEIYIPRELENVHYKRAITMRNRYMIDRSGVVVSYVHRDFGGAFEALKYARKQGREIIELGDF